MSDEREHIDAAGEWSHRSAAVMINNCFRHQHPEAYGETEVPEPVIPAQLRYGRDEPIAPSGTYFDEEPMGVAHRVAERPEWLDRDGRSAAGVASA